MVRDAKDLAAANQAEAVETALASAEIATSVAEAQVAQALGYELCKCEFPPQIMLTVGYIDNNHAKKHGAVYECPKCGYNTAGPWGYERIAPEQIEKKNR